MAKQTDTHILFSDVHQHDTRNSDRVTINYLRLKSSRFSKNYYSKTFFNKLPRAVISLSPDKFKKRIKSFLVDKSYYHVNEFLNDAIDGDDIIGPLGVGID